MVFCYNFIKRGMREKWELITNTAEFVDPANVIYFKREQEKKKKKKNKYKINNINLLLRYF